MERPEQRGTKVLGKPFSLGSLQREPSQASQADPRSGFPEVHLSGRVLRAQKNPFPSVTVYSMGAGGV